MTIGGFLSVVSFCSFILSGSERWVSLCSCAITVSIGMILRSGCWDVTGEFGWLFIMGVRYVGYSSCGRWLVCWWAVSGVFWGCERLCG